MELHPAKFQLISTDGQSKVLSPGGSSRVAVSDSMVYLGSIIAPDGRVGRELNRRIGGARSDFDSLAKVWSHSSLT